MKNDTQDKVSAAETGSSAAHRNELLISKAYIHDIGSGKEMNLNPLFAMALNRRDVFWISDDSAPLDYPWFHGMSRQQLSAWGDGWYRIVEKCFLPGGLLEIRVENMHGIEGGAKKNSTHNERTLTTGVHATNGETGNGSS